jgi:predicted small integral membrane protein
MVRLQQWSRKKAVRFSKTLLILSTAIFFTIVIFNNLIDYNSNFEFVKHVLSMDSTFEGNNLMWRAITSTTMHHLFYWIIIAWEILIAIYCWIGTINCLRFYKKKKFEWGLRPAIVGLTFALLLWFLAFITVGGEWFAMWQSQVWNGQDAAFRMFAINGITLLFLMFKDE